jgi:hypothetical protein
VNQFWWWLVLYTSSREHMCRLKANSLDKIVIENIFVVINISNQDSQFDLHMNHDLLTGCYIGWWGTNCCKSCPVYWISGHCTLDNDSCVWGCNSHNFLNDACYTATGVCSQGCTIGLEGDFCDRCEYNVLFPIVLTNDRVEYHISTYYTLGDNMFIISIRGKVWSHKTSLSPLIFIEVPVPI